MEEKENLQSKNSNWGPLSLRSPLFVGTEVQSV